MSIKLSIFLLCIIVVSSYSDELWCSDSIFQTTIKVDSLGNITKTKDSLIRPDSISSRVKFVSTDTAILSTVLNSIEWLPDTFLYSKRDPYYLLTKPHQLSPSDTTILLVKNNVMVKKTLTIIVYAGSTFVTVIQGKYPDRFFLDSMNLDSARNITYKESIIYYTLQTNRIINHDFQNHALFKKGFFSDAMYDIKGCKIGVFRGRSNHKISSQLYIVNRNGHAVIDILNHNR